jgi:hypothetical protein
MSFSATEGDATTFPGPPRRTVREQRSNSRTTVGESVLVYLTRVVDQGTFDPALQGTCNFKLLAYFSEIQGVNLISKCVMGIL